MPVNGVIDRPPHVLHDYPNFLLLVESYFSLTPFGILLFAVSQQYETGKVLKKLSSMTVSLEVIEKN